ncbi:MAG: TonB-dependent receptor domain-containing protein, partial [Verrucomicrobiales bacterium]
GNPDYRSEELIAYELGYRIKPVKSLSFDLATFYNDYDELRAISPYGTLGPLLLYQTVNAMEGQSYGAELAVNWNVTPDWKLSASYTYLEMEMDPVSTLQPQDALEGDSPQNQFQLRSYLDLPHNIQFDTSLYYVDRLESRNVPSYFKLDSRIGWQPIKDLEISLVFQNLLDPQHPEFSNGTLYTAREIERSVYGKVAWRF